MKCTLPIKTSVAKPSDWLNDGQTQRVRDLLEKYQTVLIYTHILESMDASLESTLDLDIGNYSEEELDPPTGPLDEDSLLSHCE